MSTKTSGGYSPKFLVRGGGGGVEIPGIPYDEWNSIFRFVGLPNPRSSGSKFRAKYKIKRMALLPLFTCFGVARRL